MAGAGPNAAPHFVNWARPHNHVHNDKSTAAAESACCQTKRAEARSLRFYIDNNAPFKKQQYFNNTNVNSKRKKKTIHSYIIQVLFLRKPKKETWKTGCVCPLGFLFFTFFLFIVRCRDITSPCHLRLFMCVCVRVCSQFLFFFLNNVY